MKEDRGRGCVRIGAKECAGSSCSNQLKAAAQEGETINMRVKAKFSDGHIVPLERLDIDEGAELSVEIDVEPRNSDQERMKNPTLSDGGREGPHDMEVPTINDIFDDIRKSLSHILREHGPTDGAKNYKHYLYGHPKEE